MSDHFLSAQWRNLLMINFVVDRTQLEPYCPYRTELDPWNGDHFVSLVGFKFMDTKVKGIAFPFHTDFEEVNLRFYVRYKDHGGWKRGIVFIKEIVPRRAIAWIANHRYHENYIATRMRHEWTLKSDSMDIRYAWKTGAAWNAMTASVSAQKTPIAPGSEEEFISEHYWGYTKRSEVRTYEYEVKHPRWNIHKVNSYSLQCDVQAVYGEAFCEALSQKPRTVFLADGSDVVVMEKREIA